MNLRLFAPHPRLQSFIQSIWVFESDVGVPVADSRVIVPNGHAKIIIPFKNSLYALDARGRRDRQEGEIHFAGVWGQPVVIGSPAAATGTIGIELTPAGAYRFFPFSLREASDEIVTFEEIFGAAGRRLRQVIADAERVEQKVARIQRFLLQTLEKLDKNNGITDYVVRTIVSRHGLIEVKELEKKTGYTKRYLDLLFAEHIGISPKTLAAIARFQRFYRRWALGSDHRFYDDMHDFYYDQSHFIRDFKRFTGYSPGSYARSSNEFGRIFYKEGNVGLESAPSPSLPLTA